MASENCEKDVVMAQNTKLDRELQLTILRRLSEIYPLVIRYPKTESFSKNPNFIYNWMYLLEHNLVGSSEVSIGDKGPDDFAMINARITKEGLDFLEADGGLSAIKKTITVRPDIESFLNLLKAHAETLPESEKKGFLTAIAEFSKPLVQGVFQTAIIQWLKLE